MIHATFQSRRTGFTLIEVMMSLFITALITGIVVGSMIVHARSSRSIIAQQRLSENGRTLLQRIATDMADSEAITSGVAVIARSGRVFNITNETAPQIIQYAYMDLDDNPDTIEDNVVIRREEDDPDSTTGTVILNMCSEDGVEPVFSIETRTKNNSLINVRLRVGDRTNPSTPEDDRFTGTGFQSILINTSISREEPFFLRS